MVVFRSLHATPNTIVMVPIHSYINDIRYSPDSTRWLDFVSHDEIIVILHALSSAGEKKIYGISVDGYCLETNTVYQFHIKCVHPLKGISMATVKEKTDMTSAVLRSKGCQVVELCEHEFAEQKKKNPQLQKFWSPTPFKTD
ncbi:uncharacterized protein CEXT_666731 [Caerostris extrusa]|uniref:Uncharacterized protein n=1 Tax=Caerostris extrusa TaxID=172846 RepID=A0AAV4YBZ3_CAEEX|nr:uncharacterized protein CEXT_666731 [Caerostris extrusa]